MKNVNFTEIKELIENYNSIVIYRHKNPDYDAFGSQLGLKHLILDNYPNKNVYTYGDEMMNNPDFLENMDFNKENVDLDIIKNSLTILVDTSTDDRADDKEACYKEGKCSLKIDHHEKSVETPDYGYLAPKASSCCYIITNIAFESNWVINKKAAEYLYGGMNTDTVGFTVDSVNGDTFKTVGRLLECCKELNIASVCRHVLDVRKEEFEAETFYRQKSVFKENIAYFYSTNDERKKFNITEGEAKDFVNIFSKIRNVDDYACFIEKDDEPNWYSVSLRSHKHNIRDIAVNYGTPRKGGGHDKASGIGRVSYEDTESIIKDLLELK